MSGTICPGLYVLVPCSIKLLLMLTCEYINKMLVYSYFVFELFILKCWALIRDKVNMIDE